MTVKQINIDDILQIRSEDELDLKISEMIDSLNHINFISTNVIYIH